MTGAWEKDGLRAVDGPAAGMGAGGGAMMGYSISSIHTMNIADSPLVAC
jgi:hypothetical protein